MVHIKTNNTPVFRDKGVIDVTNFDSETSDDSIGYMCGCDISVFQDGKIIVHSDDNAKEILESFSVADIIKTSNNINNCDPNHITDVSVITQKKALLISFQNQDSKTAFWNVLITLQSN